MIFSFSFLFKCLIIFNCFIFLKNYLQCEGYQGRKTVTPNRGRFRGGGMGLPFFGKKISEPERQIKWFCRKTCLRILIFSYLILKSLVGTSTPSIILTSLNQSKQTQVMVQNVRNILIFFIHSVKPKINQLWTFGF